MCLYTGAHVNKRDKRPDERNKRDKRDKRDKRNKRLYLYKRLLGGDRSSSLPLGLLVVNRAPRSPLGLLGSSRAWSPWINRASPTRDSSEIKEPMSGGFNELAFAVREFPKPETDAVLRCMTLFFLYLLLL